MASADRFSPPDQLEYGNITDGFDGQLIADTEKPIEVYSGFLKDLGLDYGWGPTALMETAIEQVYIYTGLPWWASIIVGITAIRAVVFRLYINSSDTGARMAAIKHITDPLDKRAKEARILGDTDTSRAALAEKRIIYKEAGISIGTILLPVLIQIPLGFGTFRLLRGMVGLPVPGMDVGGYLWFQDLTVPDPLYVIPLLAGLAFYKTFKVRTLDREGRNMFMSLTEGDLQMGGENGGSGSMNPSTLKTVAIVIPTLTTLVSSFWPAGLQLGIAWGSLIALTQAWLFRRLWFRDFFRMQRFPPRPAADSKPTDYKGTLNTGEQPPTEKKPFLTSLKDAYNDIVKQGQALANKKDAAARPGRTQAELKKAKAYEEKKTREAAQRRFEADQADQARKEDRRLRKSVR